ncbi:MAG: carboxymuconolactone decarboxylase family protein [Alphaproteobacteria bacterium]|nr:carboxymuconolactone decarboxylase family protein [Alphaproteobacteria bacterium]
MPTKLEGSRLERMEIEDCPPEFLGAWKDILRTRGFDVMPHVFALLANSPGAMAAVTPVGAHVRYDTDFDDVLRELVILTVAQEMGCEYEWKHHWRVAERAGASAELLAKIGSPELEAEPAPVGPAVRYARMLTHNEPIDDALVDALKENFGIGGFVDLTIMIGYYGMLARFINTVRIPVEESYDDITFNKVA